jgi:hypothetical protein
LRTDSRVQEHPWVLSPPVPLSHITFLLLHPLPTANPMTENWTVLLPPASSLIPASSPAISIDSSSSQHWGKCGLCLPWFEGRGHQGFLGSFTSLVLVFFNLGVCVGGEVAPLSTSPPLPLRNQRPILAQKPRASPSDCKLIILQILLSSPGPAVALLPFVGCICMFFNC